MDETRRELETQPLDTRQDYATQHGIETMFEGRSSTDDVTMRFGPGVSPSVAGLWREGRPARRRSPARRVAGGLLTLGLAVLSGLVVWWLLHQSGPAAAVTGVTVSSPSGVQPCGATAVVVGVIHTNGGQGDVSYRWRRSDGQNSSVFTDTLPHGKKSIRVPLRWTVQGTGTMHAIATLEVISPKTAGGTASGAFDYSCH
ncbi:hypothetical protein [Actinomadura sp. DC4]|uniref:hypothetical protein n=1 Tax=Actinomadura sp. DC4 TaxID=3055069 RepID=UPI0025AFD01D|nr:hypothetical protein [Actinomadura sp. DC4]MDN3353105.1 hypothetical protein [Actinomadura sp. DC4]